jgi:PEP-CTERM motif
MRFSKAILLSAATFMLPLLGHATSVSSNPTLMIRGLTFNDFSCTVTHQGHAGPADCGSINVKTISHPETGIQFSSGFSAGSVGRLAFDDASINYHVTSASGIEGVGLNFNGTFFGWAVSSVTETIKDAEDNIIGFANIACGPEFLHVGCSRSDEIFLPGSYNDLYITKDINVSSFIGLAQISYIDQTFCVTAAPEPSSIALLGSGLLAAAFLLRRRSKIAAARA